MMGTWLPETCWATSRREIKNTKVASSWFFLSTINKHFYFALSSKVAAHNAREGKLVIFLVLIVRFMIENSKEDRHVSTERHQTAIMTNRNAWFVEQSPDTSSLFAQNMYLLLFKSQINRNINNFNKQLLSLSQFYSNQTIQYLNLLFSWEKYYIIYH